MSLSPISSSTQALACKALTYNGSHQLPGVIFSFLYPSDGRCLAETAKYYRNAYTKYKTQLRLNLQKKCTRIAFCFLDFDGTMNIDRYPSTLLKRKPHEEELILVRRFKDNPDLYPWFMNESVSRMKLADIINGKATIFL